MSSPRTPQTSRSSQVPGAPTRPGPQSRVSPSTQGRVLNFGRPTDPIVEQALAAVVKYYEGEPVEIPSSLTVDGVQVPFIPFNEFATVSSDVASMEYNPLLQPWAGPPGTPNKVLTLYLNDGRTVLLRMRPEGDQVFPPVENPPPRAMGQLPEAVPEAKFTDDEDLVKESIEIFLKDLYNLPVVTPAGLNIDGENYTFINFSDLGSVMPNVTRADVDYLLQPWAGAPGTPNRILTLTTNNGQKYLVKAVVRNGEMFPPQ